MFINYQVGFLIRNKDSDNTKFSYKIEVVEIGNDCKKITKTDALNFIILGKNGEVQIAKDEDNGALIRFKIPKNAPYAI